MTEQTIEQKQKAALGKLWEYFGFNKSKMADRLGVTRMTVHNWFSRGRISATRAIAAERVTNNHVTKEELRPDVKEWFGV